MKTYCALFVLISAVSYHETHAVVTDPNSTEAQLLEQFEAASPDFAQFVKENSNKAVQTSLGILQNPPEDQRNLAIGKALYILQLTGNDAAIVEGAEPFLRDSDIGVRTDAIRTMAQSRSEKAVRALESLARESLESLPDNLDNDDENTVFVFNTMHRAIGGLMLGEGNRETSDAAVRDILSRFKAKYGNSPQGREILEKLNREVRNSRASTASAPTVELDSPPATPPISSGGDSMQPEEPPDTAGPTDSSDGAESHASQGDLNLWTWIVSVALILGIAGLGFLAFRKYT